MTELFILAGAGLLLSVVTWEAGYRLGRREGLRVGRLYVQALERELNKRSAL